MWRAKRLTREMQAYWKRYDRVERETRRRQEKEAEEQRKLDGELMEVKFICHRLLMGNVNFGCLKIKFSGKYLNLRELGIL